MNNIEEIEGIVYMLPHSNSDMGMLNKVVEELTNLITQQREEAVRGFASSIVSRGVTYIGDIEIYADKWLREEYEKNKD